MNPRRKIKGLLFVLAGPSGSGKTTLRNKLLREPALRRILAKSVSLTTRPKRSGERYGRDYFFIPERKFKALLGQKKILEWTKYLGYYYATPRGFADKQLARGKCLILCLDLRGVRQVKKIYPQNMRSIFILPPSLKVLRQRIGQRCSKVTQDEILRRLQLAKQELKSAKNFNHRIVNRNLAKAANELKAIILKAIRTI